MDLAQLANLGEFIGGVAVLVTLVYLAVQVRQGNDLAEADSAYKVVNTWSTFRQMVASEGLSGVWAKARNDEPLSAQEMIQLETIVDELTYSSWAAYMHHRFATYEGEVAASAVAYQLQVSTTLQEAWARMEVELRRHGLAAFADEISRKMDVDLSRS